MLLATMVLGSLSVGDCLADNLRIEEGAFGADYIRDSTGRIVGQVTPGYRDHELYVRDATGRIVGTIEDDDGSVLLRSAP